MSFPRAFSGSQCEACLCQDLRQDTSLQPADPGWEVQGLFASASVANPHPANSEVFYQFYPKHLESRGPSGTKIKTLELWACQLLSLCDQVRVVRIDVLNAILHLQNTDMFV